MKITKYNPNRSLINDNFFPASFSSLMNDFFKTGDNELNLSNSFFRPHVDISENDDQFEIHLSIPGLDKNEISLDIKGDNLIVCGERKVKSEKKDHKFHLSEISYGSFSRSFKLPENVNLDKIDAQYENGMLEIIIPKGEEQKPKKISIK